MRLHWPGPSPTQRRSPAGTDAVLSGSIDYWPFNKARNYIRKQGLRNTAEWRDYTKSGRKPREIPATPRTIYTGEWKGLMDFLGTGRLKPTNVDFWDFDKAREYVQSIGLNNQSEWRDYTKSGLKPPGIPSAPWLLVSYKDRWKGLPDWLGY